MSDESEKKPAPKIIVDDDWKEQVARERELDASGGQASGDQASGDQASGGSESAATASPEESSGRPASAAPGEAAIPPASFETLLTMFFSQGMSFLGQIPGPDGEAKVEKPLAKHTIGMLEVIEEKTKGNLSDDESKMLGEIMHALRMGYVSTPES